MNRVQPALRAPDATAASGGPFPALDDDRPLRIGIWPFRHHGDGFIVLGFASSLSLSGFDVTVYSDALSPFSAMLPFRISPRAELTEPAGTAPPVLDAIFVQRTTEELPAAYVERAILYDYSKTELRRSSGARHTLAAGVPFAHAHGSAISRLRHRQPLAASWEAFAREVLDLPQVTRTPRWRLGPEVTPRRHQRRVVIHPEAGTEAKRWPPEHSIELARRLAAKGWEPVFLLDPRDGSRWHDLYRFDTPVMQFASLADSVGYLAESAFFIGNDSGPGHLASSLGVPTLTILISGRYIFYWRPGFTAGSVVRAPGWWCRPRARRAPPSVDHVLASFEQLVALHPAGA